MKTNYDRQLEEIKGLTQLPYIGKNYDRTCLLIVGESLYTDRKHKKEYKNRGKLREIIKKMQLRTKSSCSRISIAPLWARKVDIIPKLYGKV